MRFLFLACFRNARKLYIRKLFCTINGKKWVFIIWWPLPSLVIRTICLLQIRSNSFQWIDFLKPRVIWGELGQVIIDHKINIEILGSCKTIFKDLGIWCPQTKKFWGVRKYIWWKFVWTYNFVHNLLFYFEDFLLLIKLPIIFAHTDSNYSQNFPNIIYWPCSDKKIFFYQHFTSWKLFCLPVPIHPSRIKLENGPFFEIDINQK